jgi:predicted nucleotidyltransferase
MEESKKENSQNHGQEEKSMEQVISKEYVTSNKDLKNLPVQNSLTDVQKSMEKTKKELDEFKKQAIKKYKIIESIGLLPAQAVKKIEEEYEVPKEEAEKKLLHLLVIIPEEDFKENEKIKADLINIAKTINKNIWIHLLTPVDIWNLGLDSKFEVAEAFSMSFPIFDKGFLGALRITTIHKTLVVKRFEKYVTSYVIAGSLVRGEATETSDVDVSVIIDDTDVKRMTRIELKEKLRGIIMGLQAQEATAMAGVKNVLNVQMWLLTEFWEAVKDANPIMFTFIRDGVPLYDRGAFLPWKALLKMGKIKPSPESIDMFMSAGNKLDKMVKRRLLDIVMMDIYWGTIQPTQGLLMLYGRSPGTVYDTVKEIEEIFVKQEKILEEKYLRIFKEIVITYYKGYEHGKIKEVSGKEVDKLLANAMDYNKRLGELRIQIEKRINQKTIKEIYEELMKMLEPVLNKKTEKAVLKEFDEQLIKKGRFPKRLLENLKYIIKTKEEVLAPKKSKKEKTNISETRKVEDSRKYAREISNHLIEFTQRCDFMSLEKTRFILKGEKKSAEVFFLKDIFLVEGKEISKVNSKEIVKSSIEELQKQLEEQKTKESKIDLEALEKIKKVFGNFELIH